LYQKRAQSPPTQALENWPREEENQRKNGTDMDAVLKPRLIIVNPRLIMMNPRLSIVNPGLMMMMVIMMVLVMICVSVWP